MSLLGPPLRPPSLELAYVTLPLPISAPPPPWKIALPVIFSQPQSMKTLSVLHCLQDKAKEEDRRPSASWNLPCWLSNSCHVSSPVLGLPKHKGPLSLDSTAHLPRLSSGWGLLLQEAFPNLFCALRIDPPFWGCSCSVPAKAWQPWQLYTLTRGLLYNDPWATIYLPFPSLDHKSLEGKVWV